MKKRLYIYHTFLSRRRDLGHFHSIKDLANNLEKQKKYMLDNKEKKAEYYKEYRKRNICKCV